MIKRILIAFLAVGFITSCKITDDKMRLKLDRKIERSKEKITKHERKIAGFEQRLAALEDTSTEMEDDFGVKFITLTQPVVDDFKKFIEIQGNVASKENVMVSSNTGGVLMSVLVTEGQNVSVGQALAVVNSDVLQANIREVESGLELATAVYERQKRLWEEQQIGTELQFLQAKNNKENLEKKLQTLQVQLSDATVRTTINGVVDKVYAKKGQMVGPGSVIAQVVNLQNVQVEAEVPESFVGKFKKGDKVEVYFPSLNLTRTAKIGAVGQVINPGNRTFMVQVEMPNSDRVLKPNLLANIKLKEYTHADQVIVPTRLVQDGGKGKYVNTLEDGEVVKKWLTVGESYDGGTEVLEGLTGEENLIDLGYKDVMEGDKVKVIEETALNQ